jgi:hypothetical protein
MVAGATGETCCPEEPFTVNGTPFTQPAGCYDLQTGCTNGGQTCHPTGGATCGDCTVVCARGAACVNGTCKCGGSGDECGIASPGDTFLSACCTGARCVRDPTTCNNTGG